MRTRLAVAPAPVASPTFDPPSLAAVLATLGLPPGYRPVPAPELAEGPRGLIDQAAARWAPAGTVPASGPLAVDVTLSAFAQRTDALRTLTAPPRLPDGMVARPLFPPRIGDETLAVRADIVEGSVRYVLYRVDAQAGRCLAAVAAVWRWPFGSPAWLYDLVRALMARLVESGWTAR